VEHRLMRVTLVPRATTASADRQFRARRLG
jgi:hypothetical protein